jgi:hypothetical protein
MITRHRRRDGVDADEADCLPPLHPLEGGAGGYPDAKVFICRKIDTAKGRQWRLVETRDSENQE